MGIPLQVTQDDFNQWAESKCIEYASCTIRYCGKMERLIFKVYVNGVYKVTRGSISIYEGSNFLEAQTAFNEHSVCCV